MGDGEDKCGCFSWMDECDGYLCPRCEEFVCVYCSPSMTGLCETCIAATWTDGPDSEAARAARGEGTRTCGEVGLRRLAAAMLENARSRGNQAQVDALELLLDIPISPNPAHVPAVRRVVAWEARGVLFECRDEAYDYAGQSAVFTAQVKVGRNMLEVAQGVARKVGRLLRHRDEKAGQQ